jgi:LPPG:FO 2-phospho-L-lactate transferase
MVGGGVKMEEWKDETLEDWKTGRLEDWKKDESGKAATPQAQSSNHPAFQPSNLNVVALAGGVGGAKLAWGLAQILPPEHLTLIVNTADDFEHLGLHISPDLDTVMYTLAGLANPGTGWGVRDESWGMIEMLARYGGPTWFRLGDRDLATHLIRSQWLREGFPLTWITRELCKLLGVRHSILPMSDDPVRTVVNTDAGPLPFQDYFVRRHWEPVVESIHFEGVETAQLTQDVVLSLREGDLIILCPSNPLVSLDPILALPALRRIIAASRAPKLAVTPIVGGQALRGPAAKMMRELGLEVSPVGVARHYEELLAGFVLDQRDEHHKMTIAFELGIRALVTDTVMNTDKDRVRLAREVLEFAAQL